MATIPRRRRKRCCSRRRRHSENRPERRTGAGALGDPMPLDPFYADEAVTLYHGDCLDILPQLGPVDHVITDPPYSEHTHAKQWIGAALTEDGAKRVSTAHSGLGFEALTLETQEAICAAAKRLARRWTLACCDVESVFGWRSALITAG